jgi:hypothetical protein
MYDDRFEIYRSMLEMAGGTIQENEYAGFSYNPLPTTYFLLRILMGNLVSRVRI